MTLSDKWLAFTSKFRPGKASSNSAGDHQNPHHHHNHHEKSAEDEFANLSEVAAPEPVQNRDENAHVYVHHTLEEQRGSGE